MFRQVRIHGVAGAIVWGYRTVAALSTWTITRRRPALGSGPARWTLAGTVTHRGAAFELRQPDLRFTAPRDRGRWCWPVERESIHIGDGTITALLGSPEQ